MVSITCRATFGVDELVRGEFREETTYNKV
jgi:hypothetical protein